MSPSSGEAHALQLLGLQSVTEGDGQEHLSVFVVDAEGDCGGVQEQPRLLLVHLLPETFHATLTLRRFLDTRTQTWKCGHRLVQRVNKSIER